jgi:putative ABC transport system permease protein
MLNFELVDPSVPSMVFLVQALAGIAVPLGLAASPIWSASRRTVRQALDDHGISSERIRSSVTRLPKPLRNAIRRPARLALTVGLLAAGGAMFMTAINVKRGWQANIDKVYQTRDYDVDVQLQRPISQDLVQKLGRLPAVRALEGWGFAPAAFAKAGELDVVRTYPDRGHGSLFLMAPPPATTLVHFPVKAGRWLTVGDDHAVVLNHAAAAQRPDVRVGDQVLLSLDLSPDGQQGKTLTRWRVVGVVEEIGSPAVAYVAGDAFTGIRGNEPSARLLRIRTTSKTATERIAAIHTLEGELARSGSSVESIAPLAELRTAIGDHVKLLINALVAMAIILAFVGALGLGSAMGISVVERTRELGIMKTVGASPRRIVGLLVSEGIAISVFSWFVAVALGVPLTHFVDRLIGNLGFLAPLPLVISASAALGWSVLTVAVAVLATLLPARRAASLSIRDALTHT